MLLSPLPLLRYVLPEPPPLLHPVLLQPPKPSVGLSPPTWQTDPPAQPGPTLVDSAALGQKAAAGRLVLVVVAKCPLTSSSPVRPVQGVGGPRTEAHRPASALELGFNPHSHLAGLPQGRATLVGSISPACLGRMYESFQANIRELIASMQALLPLSSPLLLLLSPRSPTPSSPLLFHQTARLNGETQSWRRVTAVAS